jgi:transcription antitermination factor NusG
VGLSGRQLVQTPKNERKSLMVVFANHGGHSALETIQRTKSASPDPLSWYAIRVQSRLGSVASTTLRGKGYEEFLPMYCSRRRWSDRIKELEQPLFPGYLFCRFNVTDRLMPILTTPGVMSIVGAGKTPISIDGEEIDAIKTILRSGLDVQPWPHLFVGCKVLIERGPLAGVDGIVTSTDKVYRLIASVSLLQRSIAVEIDREWVRPIAAHQKPTVALISKN